MFCFFSFEFKFHLGPFLFRLGGGGTWLSNGLLSAHQLWQQQLHSLANYSNELYKELSKKYPEIGKTSF